MAVKTSRTYDNLVWRFCCGGCCKGSSVCFEATCYSAVAADDKPDTGLTLIAVPPSVDRPLSSGADSRSSSD